MKNSLLLYQGNAFAGQGPRKFVKDVLRVGKWIHPITKQIVDITQDRIRNLVKNTEAYRDTLDRKAVPFQDGHNFDAKKTLGWWNRFWVDGDRLVGEVEVTDSEAAKKIEERSIRSVSARIDPNVNDTKGGVFDEAFTHVCATPLAVLDGQHDFIKLSREADSIDLLIPSELSGTVPEGHKSKEDAMSIKAVALALGLTETATPEQVEAAAKSALEAQKVSLAQVKTEQDRVAALAAGLKEHGLEAKDGKVVKLAAAPTSDETPKEKEQRLRAEKAEAAVALSRLQGVKSKIEAAAKEFVITPALVPAFTELASIESEVQALCLSADGAAVQKKGVNALERVMEIITGLPKKFEGSLQQLSGQQLDEQEKVKADAKKRVAAVLARTTGGTGEEGKE